MAKPSVSELKKAAGQLRDAGDAKSEHTIASYEKRLRRWRAFAGLHGIDPADATEEEVAAFALASFRAGVSTGAVTGNLSAVGWLLDGNSHSADGVTRLAREVLRRERADGTDKPLSPAPVLSLGALESMAAAPSLLSRELAYALVLPLLNAPTRQLALVRAADVDLGSSHATVRLQAVPAVRGRSAEPARDVVIALRPGDSDLRDAFESLLAVGGEGALFVPLAVARTRFRGAKDSTLQRIHIRNRALLGAGFTFALRLEEIRNANVGDVIYPEGDVCLNIPRSKTNQHGDIETVTADARVPFSRRGAELLGRWVEVRLAGSDPDDVAVLGQPLFPTLHHGGGDGTERLTTGEIRNIVRGMATEVALPDTVSGHSLRRSWATQAYLAGVPVPDISEHLRHRKLDTTTRYIEDLSLHLVDAASMTTPGVAIVGPGGQKGPTAERGFGDASLEELIADVRGMRLDSALAASTVEGVGLYWRQWERWAQEQGFPVFPADPRAVALFAAHRAETVTATTLRKQMRALDTVHHANGHFIAAFARLAADLIEGLGREQKRPVKQAPVIPLPDLLAMGEYCATAESPPGARSGAHQILRDRVMLSAGYCGGLRLDDLHRARVENLTRHDDDAYVLHLSVSKLNQDGTRPDAVLLERRADALDPVAALDDWLAAMPRNSGPLLLALPPTHPPRPISTENMADRLQRLAALAGCSVRPTGHSLRRSWSTHAYEAGVDLLKISRHLRHQTITMTRRYVEGLSPWPGNAAAALAADGSDRG